MIPMNKKTLALFPFERIAKNSGKNRVSKEAVEELRDVIEDYAMIVSDHAAKLAVHAGRRTVTGSDIKFIVERN